MAVHEAAPVASSGNAFSKSHPPAFGERNCVGGIERLPAALAHETRVIFQKFGISAKKFKCEGRRVEQPQLLVRVRRSPIGSTHVMFPPAPLFADARKRMHVEVVCRNRQESQRTLRDLHGTI